MFLYVPLSVELKTLQEAFDNGHRTQIQLQEYLDIMYPGPLQRLRKEIIVRQGHLVLKNNLVTNNIQINHPVSQTLLQGTIQFFTKKKRNHRHHEITPLQRVRKPLLSTKVECPICYDEKRDVEALACGHVFCSDCLRKWRRTSVACPLCRAKASS